MRSLLLISITLISFSATAKVTKLVHCLALEEQRFHKSKTVGPIYNLNKSFMNILVGIAPIEVNSPRFDESCSKNSGKSPSVTLLETLILSDKKIEDGPYMELHSQLPSLFTKYIADIEAQMPTAGCLDSQVSGLKEFKERYKYLENQFGSNALFKDKQKLIRIFNSMQNLDEIEKACKKLKN